MQRLDDRLALTVFGDMAGHQHLMSRARKFVAAAPISGDAGDEVMIILDELAANIIRYAWPEPGAHEFAVSLGWKIADAVDITIVFEDAGIAFDPSAGTASDRQSPIDDRPLGGLGLALVRALCDDIRYSRTGGRNRTVILKSTALAAR